MTLLPQRFGKCRMNHDAVTAEIWEITQQERLQWQSIPLVTETRPQRHRDFHLRTKWISYSHPG